MDEIKRKTSKLRNRGSALDENFENFDDLVLSTIQGEVPNSKLKILQIKFTEAIDSYILVSFNLHSLKMIINQLGNA